MIEDDLLSALKELREAALAMTNGRLPTSNDIERFNQAITWSTRVIELAERSE